ncbi:MAG: carboxy-S-adenosyl-L-methionine synthase CmoA [Planctomycetaceae bacterium]
MARDDIYLLPMNQVGSFVFDEHVVNVFPDMIARSVPGYASILSMIEQLASRFVTMNSHVYDLGCSLGAATLLIRRQAKEGCVIHAVDSSAAMIDRLQQILKRQDTDKSGLCEVVAQNADIRSTPIVNASFVVLNLTLQFIVPEERADIIQRIHDGMLPGGALLISEKICFDDPAQQLLMTELHHDFKRSHGYSDLEIAQKRTAIENRLIPESLQTHVDRLSAAGFSIVAPWFQCFNFASILAVKTTDSRDAGTGATAE